MVTHNHTGLDALTNLGRYFYTSEYNHPNFGRMCGDNYISRYTKGAMLLLGLVINFDSKVEMNNFKEDPGLFVFNASNNNIQNVANSVNDVVNVKNWKLDIGGNISVTAYQQGGDKNAIHFNLDGGAIKTCRLTNMTQCIEVSEQILDYGQRYFGEDS